MLTRYQSDVKVVVHLRAIIGKIDRAWLRLLVLLTPDRAWQRLVQVLEGGRSDVAAVLAGLGWAITRLQIRWDAPQLWQRLGRIPLGEHHGEDEDLN